MTKRILIAFAALGMFSGTAQAGAMFGLNAGATWGLYSEGVDGAFEVPVVGVHAIFGGKGSFSVRTYVEYMTLGIDAGPISASADSINVTALATLGNKFYVGIGPSYLLSLEDGGGSSLNLALGLGVMFSKNLFFEIRAFSDLSPEAPASFLDAIPMAFQIGYTFGKGR